MWIADNWKEYEVIDCSNGEKLERWGRLHSRSSGPAGHLGYSENPTSDWKHTNGHYHRSKKGGGEWEFFDLPQQWRLTL